MHTSHTTYAATLRSVTVFSLVCCCLVLSPSPVTADGLLTRAVRHEAQGKSVVFTGAQGERLRITPYGSFIVRVQTVPAGAEFFTDDRYEMVETHRWPGMLALAEDAQSYTISAQSGAGIAVRLAKDPMRLSFGPRGEQRSFLQEKDGTVYSGDTISASFVSDPNEHFTGLGHGYYGREEHLDLRGTAAQRNYGSAHGQQAPLIVPMYLSSKGYGVFLNSTYPNTFTFGKDGRYEISITGDGRMDYFVILGPGFAQIIDRYTQLTGRPRFPPRAVFGLALSDKGNDHTSSAPSDEGWWKEKITAHRAAGFPFDHIVNDNRWRAGGGMRCESYFAWDSVRYPDPGEYETWIRSHGLISTIDFNRCIASHSDGWKPAYNIPQSDSIEFGDSAPDFTRREVRAWFWDLFWRKSLDSALHYPGDALWIDEFDEMGRAPLSMRFENGRTWREMKNYWFFLVAKSLVQEGWDTAFHGTKRPFVWVRGMTAGAQRYATLWSGDIKPTYTDMRAQIRSMQLAGISGFPYWGHDAGGYHDWDTKTGPDDAMYRQWSMAFGSFSPFWKPHGMGQSRWPLDRSAVVQKDAKLYCDLRYELMPYIYTAAHEAAVTGMPIARAMVIGHEQDTRAWEHELQYMWGDAFLVAPNCADEGPVPVWLPQGSWFDFWTDARIDGDRTISVPAPTGKLPLFVKAGSIVPMAKFALSTAWIPQDSLAIHVYPGANGEYSLYEDDGMSEAYRIAGQSRTTPIMFEQASMSLTIGAVVGTYAGASEERAYRIVFHGLSTPSCFDVNGVRVKPVPSGRDIRDAGVGVVREGTTYIVFTRRMPVSTPVTIQAIAGCQ